MTSNSQSHIRSIRASSVWAAARRYGLALAAVGVVVILMQALKSFATEDARPALLVAIAVGTLFGGLGPGLLALALAAVVAPDPAVLIAGAILAAICAGFRHSRPAAKPLEEPLTPDETVPTDPAGPFEQSRPALTSFSAEATRAVPSFVEVTTEATWRFHHEQPLDITLPEDEQIEHLYLYSVLAECNDAFARMYGFRSAAEVIGTRLVVFLPPSNSENVDYLRSFIRSGYRLEDAESHEIDRYGNSKYFVNNLVGTFERGELVGAWGTQRDVTSSKRIEGPQEFGSRVHSTKSSSQ